MKVLILSCNIGGGHNSVAEALRDFFILDNNKCEIVDALSFLPSGWSEIISSVFTFGYRKVPNLCKKGYEYAQIHRNQFASGHIPRYLIDIGVNRLGPWIQKGNFDVVVCTHVFAGIILSDTIKKYSLDIHSGIVETDYTITPWTEECDLDWHFVPSCEQKEQAIHLGFPENRVVISGIPVRLAFYHTVLKGTAKSELGLHSAKKNVLICFGSMGCGPIEDMVAALDAQGSDCFEISVVCGTNKRLYDTLTHRYPMNDSIHVFSEVSDMSLMLDSADIYLTKPGGISTTEAAIKGVPMVILDVVGGIEASNQEYFISCGGAVTRDTVSELVLEAVSLAKDEEKQLTMSECLHRAVEQNDTNIIVKKLTGRESVPHL